MLSNEKILIIQTAFIGDVILTLPMVQVIKKHYPETVIDFLCIPAAADLLKNNPYVNNVIVYDKHSKKIENDDKVIVSKLNKILKKVQDEKYDIVISPHRSARSSTIAFFSKAKRTITFDKTTMSFMYNTKIKYEGDLHEIQRNLTLLKPIGIAENSNVKPELFPGEEEKQKIRILLNELGINNNENFITIAPGSVWFTKRYPDEKFINLIRLLKESGLKIVLVGGSKDEETSLYIKKNSAYDKLFDVTGKLSLLESAELIRRSKLLITNDSAPLHIANAMETKVIALFGATVPEFGFYPIGKDDVIFETKGLACRPCGIHGGDKCPIGTFECMRLIEEVEIVKEVKRALAS